MTTRKLTILHANDIHGQLSFKLNRDLQITGGISLMSGYIKKVRATEPATMFTISGDVLQEDIRGSDYKGTNTVQMINHLHPDAVSLGNHELDYGLAHLLIFKNCIQAPILNANIEVASLAQNLFQNSMVYETNGIKVLLIGIIPEAFFSRIMSDEFCRNMLDYKDSYNSIREEIAKHIEEAIDLVAVMSHYGIEGDRELAENMPEDIHVDLILGGHSHIDMDSAEVINDIIIAQSSYGTTHIGRFDLAIGENGGIESWKWERVPLTEESSEFDYSVDDLADRIVFNKKAGTGNENETLAEFADVFTHPNRLYESDLGDVIADSFMGIYGVDLAIVQSGSIRLKECGPILTASTLRQLYPFDDRYCLVSMTGRQIRDCFDYLFSIKPDRTVMNGEFQYSKGFRLVVDGTGYWETGGKVTSITLNGEALEDERIYKVGMTRNCMNNSVTYFGQTFTPSQCKLLSLSTYNDLAKWFLAQTEPVARPPKGRFILENFVPATIRT